MVDYEALAKQVRDLADTECDYVPLLSNVSALIYDALDDVNWAGFYLAERGGLILGPFQGKVACIKIKIGRGVCGTAAETGKVQIVPDVHKFPGHIACDSASESEVVIPIKQNGQVVGVLDIDSPRKERFTASDAEGLSLVVKALEETCDFSRIRSDRL